MDHKEPPAKSDGEHKEESPLVSTDSLTSAALARLIEEVRNGDGPVSSHYNRSYHRHNR